MPPTRGMVHRRSRTNSMRTSCSGGSISAHKLRLRLNRWNSAASATGSRSESGQKARSRAIMVLRPLAATIVSETGSTRVPAREKIGELAASRARSVSSTARGS